MRRVLITPSAGQGLHDLQAEVIFESGDTGRSSRDLSVEVHFAVNGVPVATRSERIVVDTASGAGCATPPCLGVVCGHAELAAFRVELHCRESMVCDNTPTFCDCRCGGVRMVSGPFDHPLTPGDRVSVSLVSMLGAESDLFTADDTLSLPFGNREPIADFDGDRILTLSDHAALLDCLDGPDTKVTGDCLEGDIHRTGAVDLRDVARIQLVFSGPVVPCAAASLELDWPMPGVDARNWVINNYVDLQPGPGWRDYTGNMGDAAKTYEAHKGVDVDVPTFRTMDGEFPVLAAAAGYVVHLHDDEFDRNTVCAGFWNVVRLEHAGGFATVYGHLKRDSVVVHIGELVVSGQKLAVVGSSGCSLQPQLHFEVRNCNSVAVDPFELGMWRDPPTYDTPVGLMDTSLQGSPITDVVQIKDPPPDVTAILAGETLGIGVSAAGGQAGDVLTARIMKPNGSDYETVTWLWDGVRRHSFWSANVPVTAAPAELGRWQVDFFMNGLLQRIHPLEVKGATSNMPIEP